MKLASIILLAALWVTDINKITRTNRAKRAAEEAYANGDYESAISSFRLLTDSLGVNEDPIHLNLANAYFHQGDTSNAVQFYSRVVNSDDDAMRSLAFQQLGVIEQQKNKLQESLALLKSSLKANPQNEDARYNYELVRRMIKEQEQQENQDENIEPSEYAKKLKAQADQLAQQNLFERALGLMQQGLQEDKTVAAYNSFIAKLSDVVDSQN